jgi:pimeloyl-ACP methyl ester carboxylesterase
VLTLFLFLIAGCKPTAPLAPPHCSDSVNTVIPTQDGAEVVTHRHPAKGPPVLLIHGISSNHQFWDLTEEHSLTAMLAEAGLDAWALNTRGHGLASHKQSGERQRHGWSIDDYGRYDLDAAIAHIQKETGFEAVALVGHSMGGMVSAAYIAHHGDDAISALVVVASPIAFDTQALLMRLGPLSMSIARIWPSIGAEGFAKFSAKLPNFLPAHGEGILYNPANMAPHMRRFMLSRIVSQVSREELAQLSKTLKSKRFTSNDDTIDYATALNKLTTPLLAISGSADKIAPPSSVEPWLEHSASNDETYMEMGESTGAGADYGHLDLVLGDAAREEVLNPIVDWLALRLTP